MGRIKKRAQFFTVDALIALTIIILTVIIIAPVLKQPTVDSVIQSDILQALGTLKIGDMQGIDLAELGVTDLEKPVIEVIAELHITNISKAMQLSEKILASTSSKENVGIWYGADLLASRNITPFETAENILTEKQIISGIGGGEDTGITGFSSRASLSDSARVEYFYFGGYVGEGNLSTKIDYLGNLSSVEIELVTKPGEDFEIWVNGVYGESFSGSVNDSTPINYSLNTTGFSSGSNLIEIKGDNLHISGGFVKIVYDSEISYEQPERYKFPGIDGIINLYDGLYIPGDLTSLKISLLFNNSIATFLKIGNTMVFNDTSDGTTPIIINNTNILDSFQSEGLSYDNISRRTIPLRLGMEEVDFIINETRDIDVVSSTDISGSMRASGWSCENTNPSNCCTSSLLSQNGEPCWDQTVCEGTCGGENWAPPTENKMQAGIDANNLFIEKIFNTTLPVNNLVGLNTYNNIVRDLHTLSSDKVSLHNFVDNLWAYQRTCICCGVNAAVDELLASNPSNFRSIVIMSDGEANRGCSRQPNWTAEADAIQSACDAAEEGILVYTIAFGNGADEQTLAEMADCGGGMFTSGGIDDLDTIYTQIAEEILKAQYYEQTIIVSGTDFSSTLSPESYIEFEYSGGTNPAGTIATIEENFTTPSDVSFTLPPNSTIVEANVISYSGTFWTSIVDINNNNIYNLSSYEADFIELGDPYSISIPPNLIEENEENNLSLERGIKAGETTSGSINNKVIYKVLKPLDSFSKVSAFADGCTWHIQFNDYYQSTDIPSDYSGSNCFYNESTNQQGNCNGVPCMDSVDAIQIAVYNLLKSLDFDLNGIVDVDFSEDNLEITTSSLEGIPFIYSTEVRINRWY